MDFSKWLRENKNRWHKDKEELDGCPYCYYDAEWLDIKRLGEWAVDELIEDLSYLSNSTQTSLNDDMLNRDEKRLKKIAIACLGKAEIKKRLKAV